MKNKRRIPVEKIAEEMFENAIAPYCDLKNPVKSVISSFKSGMMGHKEYPKGMILAIHFYETMDEDVHCLTSEYAQNKVSDYYNKHFAPKAKKVLTKFFKHPEVKKIMKKDDGKWSAHGYWD